jgi:hypothetical protein
MIAKNASNGFACLTNIEETQVSKRWWYFGRGVKQIELHRDELLANWELLSGGAEYFRIDPLK